MERASEISDNGSNNGPYCGGSYRGSTNKYPAGPIFTLQYNGTTTTFPALHSSEIQSPAQLIAIAEFWGKNNNYPGLHPMYQKISNTDIRGLFAGHLSRSNYLFCDGHVKSYRPTQTASPIDMWDINKQDRACTSLLNDETASVPGLAAVEHHYDSRPRTN